MTTTESNIPEQIKQNEKLLGYILQHKGLVVTVILLIIPIVWFGTSQIYLSQIASLQEQGNVLRQHVELLREQLTYQEDLLTKQIYSELFSEETTFDTARINTVKLDEEEIGRLAEFYSLTTDWKANPHLTYQQGDYAFWKEQGLTLGELRIEFQARQIVLQHAEKNGIFIKEHGDLAVQAEQVKARLVEN